MDPIPRELRFRTVSQTVSVLPGQTREYDPVERTIGLAGPHILLGAGGTCFGHRGCEDFVFDHRFDRFPGPHATNFPSTSLCVIYHAVEIANWVRSLAPEAPVTLHTCHDPEFDACLAVYLVKRILGEPGLAHGWAAKGADEPAMIPPLALMGTTPRGKPVFRWRQPEIPLEDRDPLDPARRALLQLAIVASHGEQNRPIDAPPDRSVDLLFLAAKHRRRFAGADASPFFQSMERRIVQERFQPLYDGVVADDPEFAAEVRLLERQRQLYQVDLKRSRRAIVFLAIGPPSADNSTKSGAAVSASHSSGGEKPDEGGQGTTVAHDTRVPADGVFLRDPQCLFFRHLARADRENSRLGQGFRFIALANSLSKRAENLRPNRSRYRFSIDAEWARPQKIHLVDLWTRIQQREAAAAVPLEVQGSARADRSYAAQGSGSSAVWQHGWSTHGTLIEAPHPGTMLREGSRADLSDDEAGYLAWDYLTSRAFADSEPGRFDFPWTAEKKGPDRVSISLDAIADPLAGGFRFVRIGRKTGVADSDQLRDPINAQIAERLWEWIQPVGTRGIPNDFSERHLIHRGEWVAVWNRQGIAIAHADTPDARAFVDRLQEEVKELARLTGEIRGLLHDSPQNKQEEKQQEIRQIEKKLHDGTEALARLAELHLRAQAGQSPVLRPFMEANGIMELASMVESMNRIRIQEKVEAQERRRDDRLQQTVAAASAVAIFLAWMQVERVALVGGDRSDGLFDGSMRAWADTVLGAVLSAVFLLWSFRRIKRWG